MLELLILAIKTESTEFRTQGNSLKSVNFITEKFEYLSFAKVAAQFNVVHDFLLMVFSTQSDEIAHYAGKMI